MATYSLTYTLPNMVASIQLQSPATMVHTILLMVCGTREAKMSGAEFMGVTYWGDMSDAGPLGWSEDLHSVFYVQWKVLSK